jgi:hypothetical protein
MEFVADLWLPILLSAVFVFVMSSILHMVLPFHKGDYKKLPGEEKVLAEMRAQGVQRGHYTFPCPGSMKEMCSPEMIEKYKQGPVGHMIILPSGPPTMGKCLTLWFLYSVLVSFLVAYVASFTVDYGAEYLTVFRLTGTVAVIAYAVGVLCDSIWKGQSWTITLKFVFDGVVYGLVTAGTFSWLWPVAL